MKESIMSINREFLQLLPMEIKKHSDDVLALREFLILFKNKGMDEESMLENLEELQRSSDFKETEDILLDLMDIVVGWCAPGLRIFS